MTERKNSYTRDIIGFLFTLLLSGVFLYIAFRGVDLGRLWQLCSDTSLFWIVVFTFSVLLGHYLRALRWKYLLGTLKTNASVSHLFGSLMIGYALNNVIPRLGEVGRAVTLGKFENVSRTSVLGTIVIERILDIIAFGLCLVLSGFLYSGSIYDDFPWLRLTILLGTVFVALSILFLFLSIRYREVFYRKGLKPLEYISKGLYEKVIYYLGKMTDGLSALRGAKNYFITAMYTVLIMAAYTATTYIGFYAMGMQNEPGMGWQLALIIMSISSIGVMIPTPGGVGSFHSITKAALVTLYAYNAEKSLAYAAWSHGISYLAHSIAGLMLFQYYKKRYSLSLRSFFERVTDENEVR